MVECCKGTGILGGWVVGWVGGWVGSARALGRGLHRSAELSEGHVRHLPPIPGTSHAPPPSRGHALVRCARARACPPQYPSLPEPNTLPSPPTPPPPQPPLPGTTTSGTSSPRPPLPTRFLPPPAPPLPVGTPSQPIIRCNIWHINTAQLVNLRAATAHDDASRPLAAHSVGLTEQKLLQHRIERVSQALDRVSRASPGECPVALVRCAPRPPGVTQGWAVSASVFPRLQGFGGLTGLQAKKPFRRKSPIPS